MTDTQGPADGQRVRVTLEGTYKADQSDPGYWAVDHDPGSDGILWTTTIGVRGPGITTETLTPKDPS